MTQSAGSDRDITIMGLDVFWPQTTANPPMRWNDWLIEFHMAALAEEALHLDTIITAEALTPAPVRETDAQQRRSVANAPAKSNEPKHRGPQ